MAAPKQRHTKSRRDKKRSHHALKKLTLSSCPKCGAAIIPHRVCQNCGTYNKKEVIDVLSKLSKKDKKKKEKELAAQEKERAKDKGLTMEELSR